MAEIKAIETRYKGYRFRSRLEARWAVFFDACGVAWEYEPEGYDIGQAGWYLPDFYLSELGQWVEVKPGNGKAKYPDTDACAKLALLCAETGKNGSLMCGLGDEKDGMSLVVIHMGKSVHLMNHTPKAIVTNLMGIDEDVAEDAMDKAKAARFEHGESG